MSAAGPRGIGLFRMKAPSEAVLMSRSARRGVRIPARAWVAAAAACALAASCGDGSGGQAGAARRSPRAALALQPVDGRLDLGQVVPCLGTVERTVRMANRSEGPVTVMALETSCPCMAAELRGDRVVGPGEEREVVVSLDPSGAGERSAIVDVGGAGGSLGVLEVAFTVVPVPVCVPAEVSLVPGSLRAVEVEVHLADGAPVPVLAVDPPVGQAVVAPDGRWRVLVRPDEVARLAGTPGSLPDGAVLRGPDGSVLGVRATVRTGDAMCPDAALTVWLSPAR